MLRLLIASILLCAVGTSGYFRWRARIEGGTIARREEGPLFVALRTLVTLPMLMAILTYLIDPAWMAWAGFVGSVTPSTAPVSVSSSRWA